jgi:alpha/beta hydrolase fold
MQTMILGMKWRARQRLWAGVAIAALALSACEVADPQPGETMAFPSAAIPKLLDDVHYGPQTQQVLDIYTPANANGGGLLWIHGGGWSDSDGSPTSLATEEPFGMQPAVEELYRRGWTVFSIRYAGSDEATFPSQMLDVKLAMHWVKARAPEFGVSPASVVAMGWSSGGQLAAMLGTSAGYFEPTGMPADLASVSSRPAAVVSVAGVLDPATFPYAPGIAGGNAAALAAILGCPATPEDWRTCNPGLLAAMRPTGYDDPGDSPMYIAQGAVDGIVDAHWQAAVPYQELVSTIGDGSVWLDLVDGGVLPTYGGEDPRNHSRATSYGINMWALEQFLEPYLPVAPVVPTGNRFVPLTPCRLGDTRAANSFLRLGTTGYRVLAANRCGVPANATSVAATVTVVRPTRGGAVSAAPTGAPSGLPLVTFNAGDVRANSGLVTLGTGGQIDLTGVEGNVIVDVTGAFVPAVVSTSGRYQAVTPTRVYDSRTRSGAALSPGAITTLDGRLAGIPDDAVAVAVNLTAVGAQSTGYLTAMAAGGNAPVASALNVDAAGETRGAFVVVPLNGGQFSVLQSMTAHLTVDVAGYFTGATAARSQAGLYRTNPSFRAFDSRTSTAFDPLAARIVPLAGARASAVASTMQLIGPTAGYATAWPAGSSTPTVASVNADPSGRAVANQAFIGVQGGLAQAVASAPAHVVIDVHGWFLAG